MTNYGLIGGIVHGESGIITPWSEVSPQLQKHSNSHFYADPSPIICSRLFEMLDLLAFPFGPNDRRGLLCRKVQQILKGVRWCGPWLLLTDKAFWFSLAP